MARGSRSRWPLRPACAEHSRHATNLPMRTRPATPAPAPRLAATPADAPTLADFNARLAREAEHKELDPPILRAGVEGALARPAAAQYFVAEADVNGRPQLIGQLMLTYEWSDWRNGNFWWLQSVYVHPDHRRKGAFKSLSKHVEALARSSPHTCALRLYVDCDNHDGIATHF